MNKLLNRIAKVTKPIVFLYEKICSEDAKEFLPSILASIWMGMVFLSFFINTFPWKSMGEFFLAFIVAAITGSIGMTVIMYGISFILMILQLVLWPVVMLHRLCVAVSRAGQDIGKDLTLEDFIAMEKDQPVNSVTFF